jgi:hypothetical protein
MIRIGVCGVLTAVMIIDGFVLPERLLVAEEPAAVPAKRWKQHSMTQPKPPIVAGQGSAVPAVVPADAVVLFDGKDLSEWVSDSGEPAGWTVRDGFFEVKPEAGSIQTRESFGDIQMHIEWASPSPAAGSGQNRGNSGVFLMGRYEIQILDTFRVDTYADGYAGAVYGQAPPLLNASLPPGAWQTFDIIFRGPRFSADEKLLDAAHVTVLHNGVAVQNNEPILGPTSWLNFLAYQPHALEGPIRLQDHGQPVRFRSIWVRRLPARIETFAEQAEPPHAIAKTASELAAFAGAFQMGDDDGKPPVTMTVDGKGLIVRFPDRPVDMPIVPVAERVFEFVNTDATIEFEIDASGRPGNATMHIGGSTRSLKRLK